MKNSKAFTLIENAVATDPVVVRLSHLNSYDFEGYWPADRVFQTVEALYLMHNGLHRLPFLTYFPNLSILNIDYNHLRTLADLACCSNLQYVSAYRNRVKHIKALEKLPLLKKLCLSENAITDLEVCQKLTQLEHLDVWGNAISDISPLCGLRELKVLALQYNNIYELPAAITNLRGLKELYLGENALDIDDCEAWLPQALPNTDIRFYEDLPL